MIKIIRKGTRDTRECDKCGCLFSFNYEDVSGEAGHKKRINCPQCDHTIYLDLNTSINLDEEKFETKTKCPDCHGLGTTPYGRGICITCHGLGVVDCKIKKVR